MVIGGEKTPAFSGRTLKLPVAQDDNTGRIIEYTRLHYSRDRADIEKEISDVIKVPEKFQPKPAQTWVGNELPKVPAPSPRPTPQPSSGSAPAAQQSPQPAMTRTQDGSEEPPRKKRTRSRKRKPTGEGGGENAQSNNSQPNRLVIPTPPQTQSPQPTPSRPESSQRQDDTVLRLR